MRVVVEEIGTDIGAVVVDHHDGPVLLIDPHLSNREQTRLIATLLTDDEFDGLCQPLPQLVARSA